MNDTTQDSPSKDRSALQTSLLDFIHAELVAADVRVEPGDDLLTGELLDSLAILRLATFADDTFGIGMQPADFQIENFRSVEALTAFLSRALSASDADR